MNRPVISVLVPVFNAANYLGEALQSIANQSLENFEVVIIDDASKDSSLAIASDWAGKDPRFHVASNECNLGVTRNWQRCLNAAHGDYVVKLDADDIMNGAFLETMVADLKRYPQISIACCRAEICNEKLGAINPYQGEKAFQLAGLNPGVHLIRQNHEWFQMCFFDYQLWHTCAQVYRRKDLLELGDLDLRLGCASDTDLLLRALERDGFTAHNPYVGLRYRMHQHSTSAESRRNGWLQIEGTLIHLLSLQRFYHARRGSLSSLLRKAWWRHWNNWQSLKMDSLLNSKLFPDDYKTQLLELAGGIEEPPLVLQWEGYLRQKAWSIKTIFSRKYDSKKLAIR